MDLRDYLRVLRNRWLLIVVSTLAGVAVAALVTANTTPVYTATTQVFVSAADDQTSVSSALTGSQFSQNLVKSYVSERPEYVVAAVRAALRRAAAA